jgi:hypothetical protein
VNRDLVLAAIVLIVCGALAWLPGLLPAAGLAAASSEARERAGWRRLWVPLLPAAAALALFVGWAFQEPSQTDELLSPATAALALPLAVVWMRATARAIRSLLDRGAGVPAAVVGLLRPRIVIDPAFGASLDDAARAAVIAHERAHAQHRDPLRIWLAQIATDLQWPFAAPRDRFDHWLEAVELARDDEARRAGVRGEDLASALVSAARIARHPRPRALALLDAPGAALATRIDRLLRPLERQAASGPRRAWLALAVLVITVAGAVLAGWTCGDLFLRALPFVTS